jgi:hypothetical protein
MSDCQEEQLSQLNWLKSAFNRSLNNFFRAVLKRESMRNDKERRQFPNTYCQGKHISVAFHFIIGKYSKIMSSEYAACCSFLLRNVCLLDTSVRSPSCANVSRML